MIKLVLRVLTLTIFVSLHAHSAGAFNRELLEEGLARVKAATDLPDLATTPFMRIFETNEQPPADLLRNFARIQQHVFGRRGLIELRTCSGCGFAADPSSLSVFIDPAHAIEIRRLFGKRADGVLAFMLTHELSHFTLEYLIRLSTQRLSPHGFPSPHIDQTLLAQKLEDMPTDTQRQEYTSKLHRLHSMAHAEIDLLAVISLQQMGVTAKQDALLVLNYFLKDFRLTSKTRQELILRIRTIENFK